MSVLGLFGNPRHLPIGVDFGDRSIRMLQLTREGDGLAVLAAAHEALPTDLPLDGPDRLPAIAEVVAKMLESAPFVGRACVARLPEQSVQIKNVRMPKMPADELRQAVAFEATERFSQPREPLCIQHLAAGEIHVGEELRQEVILLAAPQSEIDAHTTLLAEAGLRLSAMETTPTALARCYSRFARREADAETVRVFVDVDAIGSRVLILRGNRVAFYKRIEMGGSDLSRAVAEHLRVSDEDATQLRRRQGGHAGGADALFGANRRENTERAIFEATRPHIQDLAKEIGLCLRYYAVTFRGARPDALWLCGEEAHDPHLRQMIAEALELDVRVAEPLEGIALPETQRAIDRDSGLACWSTAAGLSLRQRTRVTEVKRGAA